MIDKTAFLVFFEVFLKGSRRPHVGIIEGYGIHKLRAHHPLNPAWIPLVSREVRRTHLGCDGQAYGHKEEISGESAPNSRTGQRPGDVHSNLFDVDCKPF